MGMSFIAVFLEVLTKTFDFLNFEWLLKFICTLAKASGFVFISIDFNCLAAKNINDDTNNKPLKHQYYAVFYSLMMVAWTLIGSQNQNF